MKKVKVINKGRRMRDRLGSRFFPEQEKIMEVNNRQHLTLKAVRNFQVEVIEEANNQSDSVNKINNKVVTKEEPENEKEPNSSDELNYHDLNIEEVLKAVEDGSLDVNEAVEHETANKNRVTLLEKLKEFKQGE